MGGGGDSESVDFSSISQSFQINSLSSTGLFKQIS